MAVSDEPKKPAVSVQISYAGIVAWLQANWTRYWEWASYGVIVLFAAGLRFWHLGERSLNHDESLHATYSWYLYLGRGYTHDPMMHGPFQFFMNAFMWKVLTFLSSAPFISSFAHWGPSDYSARLSYALFGTVFVLVPLLLRDYIGRAGALFAALFIAFSPVIVYFNRFARGDTYMAIWTLGIVVCMWRYMMDRRPLYLYLIAGLLALSFATKEVSFLIVAMFLLFLDLLFAWEIVDHVRSRAEPEAVASEENPDARQPRRNRRKEQPPPPAQPKEQHSGLWWTGLFICVVPVAWLLAIVWPFLEKLRGQWKMDKWPVSGDLLIIVGTLAGVQFAAAVQMLPFIGDKGYYLDSGIHEDTLMKMTVFLFLAVSAYIGLLWRPRTWLTAAAVFYAIFILFYTTFFTNIGGLTFAKNETGFWPVALGIVAFLAFVGPSLSLLFLPESLAKDSEYKPLERMLVAGASLGLVIFVTVFVFVLVDTGFWSGTWGSFDYWLQQQNVQRGDQPVYYYLMLLPMYDFLPLAFALAGAAWLLLRRQFIFSLVAVLAVSAIAFAYFAIHPSLIGMFPVLIVLGLALFALRLDIFDAFLVFWAGGAMIAFATAGEKMPWLTLHMTVPIIILAARSLGALYERFRISLPLRWGNPEMLVLLAAIAGAMSMSIFWISGFSSVGAALALVLGTVAAGLIVGAFVGHGRLIGMQTAAALLVPALFVFTVRDTIRANFDLGSWPREMLSYADTSPGIPRARDQLVGLAKESGLGRKYPIVVDNELAWPMVWYLRDYSPTWASSTMSPPTTGSIVILKSGHESWMEPYLDQYKQPELIRHLWWFGDGPQYYQGMSPGDFVKSLLNKNDWNVWRNYFVWRQTPWAPPPDDALVYIPKTLAVDGGTALTPPPSIPTVAIDAASQAVIGAGKLNEPTDVTLDTAGNIYVSDGKNNRIQEFSSDGTLLRTLQPADDDAFVEPWSVALGADGSIYVSDTWHYGANGRLAKYDANLNLLWATKQDAGLYGPRDLVVLPDGNLLVADTGNKRILKLSSSTGDVLAVYGSEGSGASQFNEPVGLAIGPNGDIYVADTWNGRVQHFDAAFKYIGEFAVKGWGSTEVTAKPYLTVLPDGRLIVGNPANGRIELYNQQGQPVVAWELPAASTGAKGRPVGIALDGAALLYVADCAGNQVYRLPVASLTGP